MRNKIRFINKLNVKILTVILVLFAITAFIVSWINQNNLRLLYEEKFNERVMLTNAIMANMLDSEDISYFVELMKNQTDEFKQMQVQFYHDREDLYKQQEAGSSEKEQQPVIDRLDAFYSYMAKLKTKRYWRTLADLKMLKEASRSTYVYVLADTGLVSRDGETLYTYIFDAEDCDKYDGYDVDGLGTCNVAEDALKEIYSTKVQMEKVEYYNGEYGELYYAYAPILDKNGNVIAVIGTDLELGDMYSSISSSTTLFNTIFLISIILIILIIFIFISLKIIKPLKILTNTAYELAEGNVYTVNSKRVLKQRSEIGTLANAVNDMSLVYQEMVESTGKLFDAANIGKLDVRNDEAKFKGDIQGVIKQINHTLDATTLYLNSIPESVFIMSKDFETYFRNECFFKRFGDMQALEFISNVFFQDKENEPYPENRQKFLENQITESLTRESNPHTLWINGHCYSVVFKEIVLSDETENSVLIIVIDITGITKEKEKAQAAAIAKSEFLANMSHEIRTPLNAIIGMANITKKSISDPDKALSSNNRVISASHHLLGLLNDVLDMAKIESGKLEIIHEPFKFLEAYHELNGIVEQRCSEKNIQYITNIDEITDTVLIGDKQRVNQVLINLLGNAAKFTPEGGRIDFSVTVMEENEKGIVLHFSVSDNGIGMSNEQIEKLFIPFEQTNKEVTSKYGGTGLGLAISQNLIGMMNGIIKVESELNAGSRFYFDLFFEKGNMIIEKTDNAKVLDLSEKRVLIVEDIEINREIMAAILEETGVSIVEAEDGRAAVKTFSDFPAGHFDLIFMDIQMPVMDGYEATRQIRLLDRPDAKGIPIVAISANAFKEDVEVSLASGMNDHISKPVDEDSLMDCLAKFLLGGE